MHNTLSFILIDNDHVNNLINEKMISLVYPNSEVNSFLDPHKGFEFVKTNVEASSSKKIILFLDINMPEMSGWEFMKKIEGTESFTFDKLVIYMLSSSVAPMDLQKSKLNEHVEGFLEKPLTINFLREIN